MSNHLLNDTDLCVKCGLCLPHCPTYGVTADEGDSPRGRISLMRGMMEGTLDVSPKLEDHLDGCLSCRACELVCPAEVPYGRMIDAAREHMAEQKPERTRLDRLMAGVLTHVGRLQLMTWLVWLGQRLGFVKLTRWLFRNRSLGRMASLLPPLARPRSWTGSYPAVGEQRGHVALFLGCVSRMVDGQTLGDSIKLLTHLGYRVDVPARQSCCGALASHNGLMDRADALVNQNLQAFAGDYDAILGTASGCTCTLAEYNKLSDRPEARAFADRVQNVDSFLGKADWSETAFRADAPIDVQVHTPCTLRNVLQDADGGIRLLQRVPGVTVKALPENNRCCGAAGSYFVTRPQMADTLVAKKLAGVDDTAACVATSNVGCAMHIGGALRRADRDQAVVNAVSVAAARLA
ncbi:(Fe-S)-binding protein [Abyssibacter sp.]|jgi:glycolate oxidase iron-sulfur subunit|uniref:(Fe-S)-binding protein n=1 Tax=Abyssibacter sp. TaxID=2320200 RepID=UPI0025C13A44|nr:(Fe-S)-binding protein [Abyssibacter sp.]MCK5858415.1 (Fe-S)-binding protein [Abyssibacter sp.]